MTSFPEDEIARIEREHPEGLPATQIIEFFDVHGVKFSEASLRKWVQFELLPRSVRVGHRGQQGGSQGHYPPGIIRQILEIKRLLGEGYSIEQIRSEGMLLVHEIDDLEKQIERVFEGVERSITAQGDAIAREHAKRELKDARACAQELMRRFRDLETRRGARSKDSKNARMKAV